MIKGDDKEGDPQSSPSAVLGCCQQQAETDESEQSLSNYQGEFFEDSGEVGVGFSVDVGERTIDGHGDGQDDDD